MTRSLSLLTRSVARMAREGRAGTKPRRGGGYDGREPYVSAEREAKAAAADEALRNLGFGDDDGSVSDYEAWLRVTSKLEVALGLDQPMAIPEPIVEVVYDDECDCHEDDCMHEARP